MSEEETKATPGEAKSQLVMTPELSGLAEFAILFIVIGVYCFLCSVLYIISIM